MCRTRTDSSETTESREDQTARGAAVTILDVLGVDLCARAILEHVPIAQLVRSERVSRRWQQILHHYLRSCRSLIYHHCIYRYDDSCDTLFALYPNYHRIIVDHSSNSKSAFRTVEKWGRSIIQMTTVILSSDQEYLESIALNCPYLQRLEVWNRGGEEYAMKKTNRCKQRIKFEETSIPTDDLNVKIEMNSVSLCSTEPFLKHIESLVFTNYRLNIPALYSGIFGLRNIRRFVLDGSDVTVLNDVHLLLNKMPLLEILSLSDYRKAHNISSENFVESLSRLGNLKRLHMRNNKCVNDAIVEAVAQGCKQLEYLDISFDEAEIFVNRDFNTFELLTLRGLTALCRCRPPPAVTTLCLGYVNESTPRDLSVHLPRVIRELASMGYVELTMQSLEETCRASFIQTHPFELRVASSLVKPDKYEIKEFKRDLKIILHAKLLKNVSRTRLMYM